MDVAGVRRAYIGSFTSAGGYGITTATVDPDTGKLTESGRTDAVADPSFLALSPDTTVLYTVSERPEHGGAAAFSLTDPDTPAQLGATVPVGGGAPTHLCLAAGHLLTANYASGSVSALPVGPDGALGAPRHVLRHTGGGPNRERQEAPHAHAVLPDPSGRWVLSVDLGTDSVRVCALDRVSGELGVHHETVLRAGSGPRHLVFHPGGHRAYVVNELESSVTVLAWDAQTGVLTPLGSTATLPKEAADQPNYPSEVVISPDARFIWVANRGHDSIAVLSADGDRLELLGTHPCGGHWPRHLTLDPEGRRLYAANERSGDVTWFDLEQATGRPRRAGSLPVPAASCVVFG
ncbi:lactonase family protein [Streptomyces sp. RB6PN23]|uniref:Lactonase family protein n=1 Tax=Streptomyces silvisoli TaxID=3034235 RepID=A0ABT5ZKH9_9ACTN|nr:lactonase family protein [Streptomyces silvisoli]MDF3290337.1 lactonase family protein [Streptomyces silvisoli]